MFKLLRYNCEGYANLFTYEFHRGVYVLHGDFNNNLINSFYNGIENKQGGVFFEEKKINSAIDFAKNEACVIFENDNFIPYLSIEENIEFFRKIKNEREECGFSTNYIFDLFDLDVALLHTKISKYDYLVEMKLAIIKSILTNDNVIFICLSDDDNVSQENTELINTIAYLNDKIDKIFIISDIGRHYDKRNVIYLKYFHGFVSEKIMEDL